MLTMKALDSGMAELGSPTAAVRRFALSPPRLGTSQPKCQGRPIMCTVLPLAFMGWKRLVTMALASRLPRALLTRTTSPLPMPRSLASSGSSSAKTCGSASTSHEQRRVMRPVCQCSVTR